MYKAQCGVVFFSHAPYSPFRDAAIHWWLSGSGFYMQSQGLKCLPSLSSANSISGSFTGGK